MTKSTYWLASDPLARITHPDHQPRETPAANQALYDYAMLGAGRSLQKLHRRYQTEYKTRDESPPTQRLATITGWSLNHDWQRRIDAWAAQENGQALELWQERSRELRQRQYELAQELMSLGEEALADGYQFTKTTTGKVQTADGGEQTVIYVKFDGYLAARLLELAFKLANEATSPPASAGQDSDNPLFVATRTVDEWRAEYEKRRDEGLATLADYDAAQAQAQAQDDGTP